MEEQEKQTQNNVSETQIEGTVFKERESKAGPLIGSIIIIIIILVGGLYFMSVKVDEKKQQAEEQKQQQEEQFNLNTNSGLDEPQTVEGVAEEFSSIEEDLEAMNLDDLDAELGDIEEEFNSLESEPIE